MYDVEIISMLNYTMLTRVFSVSVITLFLLEQIVKGAAKHFRTSFVHGLSMSACPTSGVACKFEMSNGLLNFYDHYVWLRALVVSV